MGIARYFASSFLSNTSVSLRAAMAPDTKKARTGEKEAGAKSQAKPSLAPTVACEDEVASKMKWAMSQLQTTLSQEVVYIELPQAPAAYGLNSWPNYSRASRLAPTAPSERGRRPLPGSSPHSGGTTKRAVKFAPRG